MEVVGYKGQVVENDSNLLSSVPEVESLICYDWGDLDRPSLSFWLEQYLWLSLCEMIMRAAQERSHNLYRSREMLE